jgi:hypothetical protein
MIISSFSCNAIVNNTITAALTCESVYSNVVIQIAEYGSSGQITDWISIGPLVSTTQTITYTITNPNTTNLNVRLASTSPICDHGSGSSGSEDSGSSGSEDSGSSGSEDSGSSGSEDSGSEDSGSEDSGSSGSEPSGSEPSGSEPSGNGDSGVGSDDDGSDYSGSEESGSEESGGSTDIPSGGSNSGGSDESGSGSGSGGGGGGELPTPPSSPDQHILWPPVRIIGGDTPVLVDKTMPPNWREATNPWRDIYDENYIENKWTLFYYEIVVQNNEDNVGAGSDASGSDDSGSDSGSYSPTTRTVSAIWVKRLASVAWPGGNVFATYYTYGNPTGLTPLFIGTAQADIGAEIEGDTPMYFSGNIDLEVVPNIETVGGYLIETMKYIADNNYIGDGSNRIMGANVNVLPMGDILSVPHTTTTEELDELTIALLET